MAIKRPTELLRFVWHGDRLTLENNVRQSESRSFDLCGPRSIGQEHNADAELRIQNENRSSAFGDACMMVDRPAGRIHTNAPAESDFVQVGPGLATTVQCDRTKQQFARFIIAGGWLRAIVRRRYAPRIKARQPYRQS